MISYLIDTDWIIDYLKGKEAVVEAINSVAEKGLAVSIISIANCMKEYIIPLLQRIREKDCRISLKE